MTHLNTLHNTGKQFGIKISPLKYEVMVFREEVPSKSRTVIDNTVFEQINIFTHLGYKISYEE
jgi:hypothetical protein